jgi:hypothetical protein
VQNDDGAFYLFYQSVHNTSDYNAVYYFITFFAICQGFFVKKFIFLFFYFFKEGAFSSNRQKTPFLPQFPSLWLQKAQKSTHRKGRALRWVW